MEQTERIGVAYVEMIVNRDLGWVFREQTTDDYGIDALIEVAGEVSPEGKLIAVQIKAGESYFREQNEKGVIFRFDDRHKNYWTNHSLPVIIVLFNPKTKECIWEILRETNIQQISKGRYKITIPQNKIFDKTAKAILLEAISNILIEDIVKKYHAAIYDDSIDDIFPMKACPVCGNADVERKQIIDPVRDDVYFTITCKRCDWNDWTQ